MIARKREQIPTTNCKVIFRWATRRGLRQWGTKHKKKILSSFVLELCRYIWKYFHYPWSTLSECRQTVKLPFTGKFQCISDLSKLKTCLLCFSTKDDIFHLFNLAQADSDSFISVVVKFALVLIALGFYEKPLIRMTPPCEISKTFTLKQCANERNCYIIWHVNLLVVDVPWKL